MAFTYVPEPRMDSRIPFSSKCLIAFRTLSITLSNYTIGEMPNTGINITAMKIQMVAMLMGCITLLILILAVLKIRFS